MLIASIWNSNYWKVRYRHRSVGFKWLKEIFRQRENSCLHNTKLQHCSTKYTSLRISKSTTDFWLPSTNRIICHYELLSCATKSSPFNSHRDASRETLFSNNRHQLALYETRAININSLFSKNSIGYFVPYLRSPRWHTPCCNNYFRTLCFCFKSVRDTLRLIES